MTIFKHNYFLSASLVAFALSFLVHAQQQYDDQSGFISLDCGLAGNSNYTESTTLINYISDADFIDAGESRSIAYEYTIDRQEQVKTLRSFPHGIRNCYKINVTQQLRYLIRATFYYGNYDALNSPPEFDLHLGGDFFTTIRLYNVSLSNSREIIYAPLKDYISFCLVNTGSGTPFISSLELRPMDQSVYYNNTASAESLFLVLRYDVSSTLDSAYRFPYDVIDRFWAPGLEVNWIGIDTSETVDANSTQKYRPPSIVMSTAGTPANESEAMQFGISGLDPTTKYYYYLHFAELRKLEANETRAFNISINEKLEYHSLAPRYLRTTTVYNQNGLSGSTIYAFSLDRIENSTLPPLINAYELYSAVEFLQSETDVNDVDAISKIKSVYGVEKNNWDGDPCVPKDYLWTGLNCSYSGFDPPRITSLSLSSSGLTGVITPHIAKLTMIQSLDLSNNNLTGSVPEFLAQLPNLRVLNLERNKLTGSIPDELIKKANEGSLSLSFGENVSLCSSSNCNTKSTKKSNSIIVPVVASVGAIILLLVLTAVLIGIKKRKRQVVSKSQNNPFESIKRQFTHSEVREITNNFERTLGKGGFGTVYHGSIDDNTQVAVKMLSSSSKQSYKEFQAEVSILMKVYHGNLTSLIGYCNDGTNLALIYEFMPNGDLGSHLSGNKMSHVLSWEARLHIVVDAAQGLEYLHNGCNPPIIHRDIKPANILLAENFRAKLADFGLSRSFSRDGASHVSTAVAGTPGYLDPTYSVTGWLNEKSDVYSFGVVLLVIITGRPAIFNKRQDSSEWIHVSQWVVSMLGNGVITSVVDPNLRDDFESSSAWKIIDIGMACVSQVPSNRPNMSDVVRVLKDCLAVELALKNSSIVTDSTSVNSTPFSPLQDSKLLG